VIYEGSIPVEPGSMVTSRYANYPTLAGAETLLSSTLGFNSQMGSSVKTKPIFNFKRGRRASNSLRGAPNYLYQSHSAPSGNAYVLMVTAFLNNVFLPMTNLPFPLKIVLLICYT